MGTLRAAPPPDHESFRGIVDAGEPVVFPGAVERWPARRRWGWDDLRRRAGARRVPVELYPDGSYFRSWLSFETTVERYLQLVDGGEGTPERYYMAEVRLERYLPELAEDVWTPEFLDERLLIYRAFFAGKDTITGLHFHPTNQALLCQVVGTKELTLYSPTTFDHLHFEPFHSHRFNFSRLDFDMVDDPQDPGLRDVAPLSYVLKPGDACFIPIHWPHLARGHGESMSVAYFWRAHARHWRPTRTMMHAVMGQAVRSGISRPLARLLERGFGYRVVR